jgi:hypothetical protein
MELFLLSLSSTITPTNNNDNNKRGFCENFWHFMHFVNLIFSVLSRIQSSHFIKMMRKQWVTNIDQLTNPRYIFVSSCKWFPRAFSWPRRLANKSAKSLPWAPGDLGMSNDMMTSCSLVHFLCPCNLYANRRYKWTNKGMQARKLITQLELKFFWFFTLGKNHQVKLSLIVIVIVTLPIRPRHN